MVDSFELKAIEDNADLSIPLTYYWYDVNEDVIKTESRDLAIKTNTDITKLLENQLKSGSFPLFTKNTKINSLEISRSESLLLLDLSKDFISEMQAGSGVEGQILKCITDTMGKFYDVKKLQITIDGQKYASGHIEMEIGEYLEVSK